MTMKECSRFWSDSDPALSRQISEDSSGGCSIDWPGLPRTRNERFGDTTVKSIAWRSLRMDLQLPVPVGTAWSISGTRPPAKKARKP